MSHTGHARGDREEPLAHPEGTKRLTIASRERGRLSTASSTSTAKALAASVKTTDMHKDYEVDESLPRETVEHIRKTVNEKFPKPQARKKFLRVFEEVLHGAAGDDGVTWWRKMGKLDKAITTSIGELLQLVYMLTAFGALGQLWHVDQNPINTNRRDVGFGILALGVAVYIYVVDGSHE